MRQYRAIALFSAPFLFAASSAAAQSPAPRPALEAEQAIQLIEEAGFHLQDGHLENRCGAPSNPRVAFIDLNGDGRAEAHIADVAPDCYEKPGAYFAILAQKPDGRWKRLIAEDGIVGFERARSQGWNDLSLDEGDSTCPGVRHFNGTDYGAATACGTFAMTAGPAPTLAWNGPLSREKLFDWPADDLPGVKTLSTADSETLFRAAGMEPIGGGVWTGCPDDESGHSEASIVMMRDLNDDGRPEAMIRDGGIFCNGHAGVRSIVLTTTATGEWRVVYENRGFANFLVSRGADNFPDIENGLPGFCLPYFRWNGVEYALIARLDGEGKACDPFG